METTDIYPSDAELNAHLATHAFGWQGVRWLPDKEVYVGTPPRGLSNRKRPEAVVPDVMQDALRGSALLQILVVEWGLPVQFEPLGKTRVVTARVGTQEARGASVRQALCRAAWLAMEAGEDIVDH